MVNPPARCPLSSSLSAGPPAFLPAPTARIPSISNVSSPLAPPHPHQFSYDFTMAKFRTAIFAAALLCLFTVSLSRSTPASDDSSVTTQIALPLSSIDPGLPLPSETDDKVNTETDPNSAAVSAVPLTEVSFRPVNRRFHLRSKRPCRHHFKFYPTLRDNEISYGNDMILSSGENSDFEQPIVRGGGKWMRMHHHLRHRHHVEDTDSDSDSDSDDEEEGDRLKKVAFKRYDYDRFDREKQLKKLREHFRDRKEEAEKKKKGGFMFRVRKFLDRYT